MKNLKRLIVTMLVSVLLAAGPGSTAFASEAVNGQPAQDAITYETENTAANLFSAATDTAVADELSGPASEEASAEDTGNGEFLPLEGYEIYIDEQGEVYYLEKEPEELVIIETKEEEPAPTPTQKPEAKKEETVKAKPSYSEKDLRLLSCLVYSEAGNQSYKGMLAVANVVLNRVKSPIYSHCNTIKEVIYDKKWSVQFAVTVKSKKTGLSALDKALKSYDTGKYSGSNPEAEKKAMEKAIKAAKAALQGENNIGNYLCFNAVNKYTSKIKKQYPDYKIIGDHIFYRTK